MTRANICSIYGGRKCVFVEASGELMQTRPIKGPPGDRSKVRWLMFWDSEKSLRGAGSTEVGLKANQRSGGIKINR